MKILYEKVEQWYEVKSVIKDRDDKDIVNYVEDSEPTDAMETVLYEFVDVLKNGEEKVLCSSINFNVVMDFICKNYPDFYRDILEG